MSSNIACDPSRPQALNQILCKPNGIFNYAAMAAGGGLLAGLMLSRGKWAIIPGTLAFLGTAAFVAGSRSDVGDWVNEKLASRAEAKAARAQAQAQALGQGGGESGRPLTQADVTVPLPSERPSSPGSSDESDFTPATQGRPPIPGGFRPPPPDEQPEAPSLGDRPAAFGSSVPVVVSPQCHRT